jgi:chorismate mutase/prephenate dehydratase
MDLDQLRQQIDAIDREVLARLNERIRLAGEIGRVKREQGSVFYVPAREEQVFERLEALNGGPMPQAALRAIYREVISASIALQKPLRIAYLGPEATYTHQAALKNFGTSLNYDALRTIPDVFSAVERGEADYGVVPVENSTEGGVQHSLDMLAECDLKIVAQIYLPIEHCLISTSPLESIQRVISKDQALAQCRGWLQRHLPNAECVPVDSTAAAVRTAAEEPGTAAIAAAVAAQHYGVPVVKAAIQDRQDNVTRFLVIGRLPTQTMGGGRDKTSLVFSVKDETGTLQKALEPFARRSINLTKIESRPSRRKAWDYYFFIDLIGHWDEPQVAAAVADLSQHAAMVKWLGSYPNTR